MAQLIATQMFDRFVEDRVFSPRLPEVLFFDHSINQKLNRSLTLGKKKYDCSFLDDRSDDIQETFIAPAPSNIGLPDDGTVYSVRTVHTLHTFGCASRALMPPLSFVTPTVQSISKTEKVCTSSVKSHLPRACRLTCVLAWI